VTEKHLKHIFSFYGPSLASIKKDSREWSKALVVYANRQDALYSLEHLSKDQNTGRETIIDGQSITLNLRKCNVRDTV